MRLFIASHCKLNVKRSDRIYLLISVLSALQYVISENPLHLIAFSSVVFHCYARVGSPLGIQRGIRESHAYRKRRVYPRVKYESPLTNFYLEGGTIIQKSSHWLFGNDCCLSFSQPFTGFGHNTKPVHHALACGLRIQRKHARLWCGDCGLSRATTD